MLTITSSVHRAEATQRVRRPGLLQGLSAWHHRAASRRALMAMPPRMLADIGLSRSDAIVEAMKPFWRS